MDEVKFHLGGDQGGGPLVPYLERHLGIVGMYPLIRHHGALATIRAHAILNRFEDTLS